VTARLLITGSNRGTGLGIAQYFYDVGYQVASLNRSCRYEDWLGEIQCDLTDVKQFSECCSAAIAQLGGVDVCVVNAAIRRLSAIEVMDDDAWCDSIETNLSCTFRLARRMIGPLRESQGTFVVMGSHAASHAFEGGAAYCASKAALKALMEVFILETRPMGIRTLLVNAGAIRNRRDDASGSKISPSSIGQAIHQAITMPSDAMVAEIDIRPSIPVSPKVQGMDRLQSL
jgi:3-oxoacyl-[acyl-carrier protein] reductase